MGKYDHHRETDGESDQTNAPQDRESLNLVVNKGSKKKKRRVVNPSNWLGLDQNNLLGYLLMKEKKKHLTRLRWPEQAG